MFRSGADRAWSGAVLAVSLLMAAAVRAQPPRNNLSRVPPMGWMGWEIFRCNVDCVNDPFNCISEQLYRDQADALVDHGFLAAGYNHLHPDDCWMERHPPRDPATGQLRGDLERFPSGMKALGDYIHSKGIKYAMYTAESPTTCAGYPASANHEQLDAATFADWGVDYLKVDGCGDNDYYPTGYRAMGAALANVSREIEYSCSWPAYQCGGNESCQPFATFIEDGCNGWRNYADIQCNWGSLSGIIDHWGAWGRVLQPWAGPGHWHDMDTILAGNGCITHDEERTQVAIWAISASPFIMGNDPRNVSAESTAILLNKDAIAVSQDPLGQMGIRLSNDTAQQLWARNLANGDVAVALYNKAGPIPMPPPIPHPPCNEWVHTTGGFWEPEPGNNLGTFEGLTAVEAEAVCCQDSLCAGFSITAGLNGTAKGGGFYKGQPLASIYQSPSYEGFAKKSQVPPPAPPGPPQPADITLDLADLDIYGPVRVFDIFAQKDMGLFTGKYTAKAVPHHGTAFLRLERV